MSGKFSIVLIFVLMLTGNIHLQQEYENENERNDQETDEDLDETFSMKWYFNFHLKRCIQFHYSGIGGNANNFDTCEDCFQRCYLVKKSSFIN